MIKFRQKDFSLFSSMLSGAGVGAGVGTGLGVLGANLGAGISFREKKIKIEPGKGPMVGKEALTTTLVGAGLGAFVGAICGATDWINKKCNQASTVNARLMKDVVEALKKSGLKEGQHFTRDPKEASRIKTKVCIAVSRVNGDTRIAINQVSDNKLKDINKDLMKNIPNTAAVTEKQSDRFNDIVITSISDSSADAGLLAGVAERYIHSGYPVYLVEVG